jgi:5-methylcytosine-specific restriction endonuclease McrA
MRWSKGHHPSPATEFKKGCHPANEFRKGHQPPYAGKSLPIELCQKISQAHKGVKLSAAHRKAISEGHKGLKYPNKKPVSDLTRKRLSEAHKGKPAWWKVKGVQHPAWRGGVSSSGYAREFNSPKLKEFIRNRDKRKCQLCGCPETECLQRLRVHHINYNKQDTRLSNLISLCNICNSRVNHKVFWYMRVFQNKLRNYKARNG